VIHVATNQRTTEDTASPVHRATPGIWGLIEIRLVFVARVVSVMGDWLYQIALIWLILEVTNSPLALSAVAAAQIVPLVVVSTLLTGRLAAVVTPSRLAVFDVLQAVTVLAFPVLYWTGHLHLGWFVAVSVVVTVLDSVCDPGLQALVPQLVDRSRIPAVHSLFDLTKRLGRIAGPGFASALLMVLPVAGLFVVDSVSFAVSALCMVGVGRIVGGRLSARTLGAARPTDAGSTKAARAYVRANPVVLWLFALRNTQNLLWAVYLIGVPLLVQRVYHGGPVLWGLLIAAYAGGQLTGNLVTTRHQGYRSVTGVVLAGWLLTGLGFLGLGVSTSPALGATFLVIGGAGSAAATVTSDSYVGVAVPPNLQPAAFSWQFTGNQLTQMIGTVLFGVVLGRAPVGATIAVTGLAMVAVATAAGYARHRWRVRPAAV
jgi:MFS family permease